MANQTELRNQLLELLDGGHAHRSAQDILRSYPTGQVNQKIEGVPYTPWQLLEHMRLAQRDILDFIRDADHVSPPWPEGY